MTSLIFLFGLTVGCCVATWLAHLRITELDERVERLANNTFESLDELTEQVFKEIA